VPLVFSIGFGSLVGFPVGFLLYNPWLSKSFVFFRNKKIYEQTCLFKVKFKLRVRV
jgi:hypothetical protein